MKFDDDLLPKLIECRYLDRAHVSGLRRSLRHRLQNADHFQAELCKADVRGRLVTTEVFFVALGVSSAYFMDYGFSFIEGPAAWRVPIALQIPMAMGVAVLVVGLPETPRWLWQQGRKDEAVAVMVKVHDVPETDAYVLQESEEIAKAIEIESNSPFKWSRIFQRDALQTGYRVGLACLVLFMNQVGLDDTCSPRLLTLASSGPESTWSSSTSRLFSRTALAWNVIPQSLQAAVLTSLSRQDLCCLLWVWTILVVGSR